MEARSFGLLPTMANVAKTASAAIAAAAARRLRPRRAGEASASSAARRISVAVWKRSLGWRASAFITSASTASGISRAGAQSRGRSGLPLVLASRMATAPAPAKGSRPVSIS